LFCFKPDRWQIKQKINVKPLNLIAMKTYKTTLDEFKLRKVKSSIPRAKIKSSHDAANYIRQFYDDDIEIYESFFLLLLNRANNTTDFVKISQGGISGTVIDVKLIAKYAIENLASNIIIAHNHPSGNIEPSQADISITDKVIKSVNLFDIKVLDHIILTSDEHKSFADNGLI
jgi:DNA repair protein RadC